MKFQCANYWVPLGGLLQLAHDFTKGRDPQDHDKGIAAYPRLILDLMVLSVKKFPKHSTFVISKLVAVKIRKIKAPRHYGRGAVG